MTFVNIEAVGAEEIPVVKRLQPDTYLVISVGSAVNSKKTKTFDHSNRPQWNQQFSFILPDITGSFIKCILFNYDDFRMDESISKVTISTADLEYGRIYDEYYNMDSAKGSGKGGRLHLKIQLAPRNHQPFTPYTGKIPKGAKRPANFREEEEEKETLKNGTQSKKETSQKKGKTNSKAGKKDGEKSEEKVENAAQGAVPNVEGDQSGSFMIPLPSFQQSGMPNGYQAVVYIMPTNQTPTQQTTWKIMDATDEGKKQEGALTSPNIMKSMPTIQALSETQQIPKT